MYQTFEIRNSSIWDVKKWANKAIEPTKADLCSKLFCMNGVRIRTAPWTSFRRAVVRKMAKFLSISSPDYIQIVNVHQNKVLKMSRTIVCRLHSSITNSDSKSRLHNFCILESIWAIAIVASLWAGRRVGQIKGLWWAFMIRIWSWKITRLLWIFQSIFEILLIFTPVNS